MLVSLTVSLPWESKKYFKIPKRSSEAVIRKRVDNTTKETRGSVGWACVAHLSFCFEEA